jgi:uncharacterized paraquat-inducible protein A
MTAENNEHERYQGVDRSILDEDTWAPEPEKVKCPECGMRVSLGTIRCPRCNRFILMGCSGSCSSCGSRTCMRTGQEK